MAGVEPAQNQAISLTKHETNKASVWFYLPEHEPDRSPF